MDNNKIRVGITHGDTNGIGYEVIIKALGDPAMCELCTPIIYGSQRIATFYRKGIELESPLKFNIISSATDADPDGVNLVEVLGKDANVDPGVESKEAGEYAFISLEWAVADLKDGLIDVLVTAPINKNNIQKDVGYLYPYYQKLFYIFDDDIDIYHKLWITVTSRVNTSSSQNKKMFYQREIFGVTPLTLTDELLKDNIIGETIWRYTFDKNPINFNSVILNKQLRYFAKVKYAKDLIAVDNEVGSDGLTGVDKLEMNQFHADESRIIFSDINIPDTISRLKKKIMIDMPKEEIEYYMEFHKPSDFHVELVNTFYATDFGGYSDLSLPTKREYMTLLVLLKRRLQIEGQKYLPLILSGNIHTKLNVRTIQNTKFLTKIQTSDLYQDLINNKYRYLIEYDPKAILNKISILINNTFTLVDYDLQDHFGENIEIVNDVVSDEFLNFYKEA